MKTRLIAALAVTASLAAAGAAEADAAPTASAAGVKKATKLLQGKRYHAYAGGKWTNAGTDRIVDLCRRGRFRYESTTTWTTYDDSGYSTESFAGRWRVLRAKIGRASAWARVRFVNQYGQRGTYTFVANRRGVYVNGQVVEVTRNRC